MMHTLIQTPRLARLTKTKFLSILAVSVLALAAPYLRADAGPDHGGNNSLAGTWFGAASPGVAPNLASFLSDGRVIFSRPVTVITGPTTFALVSTGHGEWVRTGHNEFAFTMYLLAGETSVEFNVLIKVAATLKLNGASGELTETGMLSATDPDGNPLFSFPVNQVFRRIVAGE